MKAKKRILIVDDEEPIRILLEEILGSKYLVETAENGKEALEKLPVFRPDLVLLDVIMPVMDGLETCRLIRKSEKFKFVKVIFLSGRITLQDRLEGYRRGADDYVKKPFEEGELLSKVDVFMRLKNIEEVDKLKGDIFTLLSHETNTPLHGIFTPAKALMEDNNFSKEQVKEMATYIYESALWLHENFKKIRLLVKLKAGSKLYLSAGSLREGIELATIRLEKQIQNKNVSIKTEIEPGIVINADWELMGDTFYFLIDNAIKYSPDDDEVTIKASIVERELIIRISDNGPGIKQGRLNAIFHELSIENVMAHQKGIGISLAICKLIMEHHDGSIKAESEAGKGSTFILKIPVN